MIKDESAESQAGEKLGFHEDKKLKYSLKTSLTIKKTGTRVSLIQFVSMFLHFPAG